jgi:uncharacterized protein YcaQ
MQQRYTREQARHMLDTWVEAGWLERVQVEGMRELFLVLGDDVSTLKAVEKGNIPKAWKPKEATTLEEVTFLSPLDIVSARGRAKKLFDFEYKWEVYTPTHKRRWGYYVLPVLYGDDLVARLDPRLDRKTMTLEILGFWHEEDAPIKEEAFTDALAKGLIRFADFVGAKKLDLNKIKPASLQSAVLKKLKSESELIEKQKS